MITEILKLIAEKGPMLCVAYSRIMRHGSEPSNNSYDSTKENRIIMNEDFVTYELAVKLKEKGLNIPFYFFYRSDDKIIHHAMIAKPLVYCDKIDDEVVCAPTISQVLKWLRVEKRIDAGAVWDNRDGKWIGYINEMDMPDLVGEYVLPNTYDSYEQAAIAGVKYVLDNLI